ncbi:MAG: hypothetical protein OES13_00515 [Acidimicrobiia bacterium]|nr:hypothetical protein [Acidimicrobiia bacterium]
MELHRDDRGFKGVELGMGLLIVGILAAIAIPLMSQVSESVEDVVAAAENRAAEVDLALAGGQATDQIQVAGVQLERATDGSTCLWNLSSAGAVTGMWQSGTLTLYGTFDAKPALCPTAGDAEAAGFSVLQP